MVWLAANWKIVTGVVAICSAIGTAALAHVDEADGRLDKLEVQAVRDSTTHRLIQQDVGEIKCMVVQNAQGEDPLDCIE